MTEHRAAILRQWRIDFDAENILSTLHIIGSGVRLEGSKIYFDFPFIGHEFIHIESAGKATLRNIAGNKIPVFIKTKGKKIRISNTASLLLDQNEICRLSTFVICQQLAGGNFPQENIFADLFFLEASAIYSISKYGVQYVSTSLPPLAQVTPEDVYEEYFSSHDLMYKSGKCIVVLLSGGYDSRLNFATALFYSKKYGNKVFAYHEIKDKHEHDIATAIARRKNVPLTCKTRDDFHREAMSLMCNKEFILSQSGVYRNNILRWHGYLDFIRDCHSDSIISGFGAEAHKGKYYLLLKNINKDAPAKFGADENLIRHIAGHLRIKRFDKHAQRDFFRTLLDRAEVYESIHSKIDFVHYHTYIANGYGKRCHDFIQYFSLGFPMLEDAFLRKVFSLSYVHKINFKIVTELLFCLEPDLLEIPFVSGNIGSTKKRGRFHSTLSSFAAPVRKILHTKPKNRGRTFLNELEERRINEINPLSQLTKRLKEIILERCANSPGIKLDYAIELFLYLAAVEEECHVEFDCI